YGSVLAASGRWDDAERELASALDGFERGHRALRIQALSRLVDLHLAQGKIQEAGAMVRGLEDHDGLALPLARLSFLRGEIEAARIELETALAQIPPRDLAAAPYHSLIVEVALALGDEPRARLASGVLMELAEIAGSVTMRAEARLANARLMRLRGESGVLGELRAAL